MISEAWQLFTQQLTTWILAVLVTMVAMIIPMGIMWFGMMGSLFAMIAGGNSRAGAAVGGVGAILALLVGVVLTMVVGVVVMGGMFRMAIKQVRGEPIQLSDLWSVTDVLPQLVIAGVLMGLAVGIGSMLCYLPGIAVGGLLMLAIPLVVDQKMAAMDALNRSWNTLKPEWLMAAALYLVLGIIVSVGASLFGIGIFITYPLFFLANALVYRDFILGNSLPPGGGYPAGVTPGGMPPDTYSPPPPPAEDPR